MYFSIENLLSEQYNSHVVNTSSDQSNFFLISKSIVFWYSGFHLYGTYFLEYGWSTPMIIKPSIVPSFNSCSYFFVNLLKLFLTHSTYKVEYINMKNIISCWTEPSIMAYMKTINNNNCWKVQWVKNRAVDFQLTVQFKSACSSSTRSASK